jgi:hypothetical protein
MKFRSFLIFSSILDPELTDSTSGRKGQYVTGIEGGGSQRVERQFLD